MLTRLTETNIRCLKNKQKDSTYLLEFHSLYKSPSYPKIKKTWHTAGIHAQKQNPDCLSKLPAEQIKVLKPEISQKLFCHVHAQTRQHVFL